jgi:hypothetical protein
MFSDYSFCIRKYFRQGKEQWLTNLFITANPILHLSITARPLVEEVLRIIRAVHTACMEHTARMVRMECMAQMPQRQMAMKHPLSVRFL